MDIILEIQGQQSSHSPLPRSPHQYLNEAVFVLSPAQEGLCAITSRRGSLCHHQQKRVSVPSPAEDGLHVSRCRITIPDIEMSKNSTVPWLMLSTALTLFFIKKKLTGCGGTNPHMKDSLRGKPGKGEYPGKHYKQWTS